MMPEHYEENNDRDWDAKKPGKEVPLKGSRTCFTGLPLRRQTVNHDQHNRAVGRPRALDWGEAGLVEAVAYPHFCGN
jgi:hypothetical protein